MANPFLTAFLNNISERNSVPGAPFVPFPGFPGTAYSNETLPPARKRRRKTEIEYIEERGRRRSTFYKRKASLLSKADELATLSGCQVMVVVASDSGHVHSYSTKRFAPLVSTPEAHNLIELCLSSPGDEDDQWQPPKYLTFEKTINGNGKDNQTEAAESGESGNEEPADVSKDVRGTPEQPMMNPFHQTPKNSGNYDNARRHENALPVIPPHHQFLFNNPMFPPFLFPDTENEQKDASLS